MGTRGFNPPSPRREENTDQPALPTGPYKLAHSKKFFLETCPWSNQLESTLPSEISLSPETLRNLAVADTAARMEAHRTTRRTNMKRLMVGVAILGALAAAPLILEARAESPREEAREHPRIRKAIREMEDAVAYLEAAPHDFGGHKAAAIEKTREAIAQLKLALEYRAAQDTRRGR
jgi:hypothetical protein